MAALVDMTVEEFDSWDPAVGAPPGAWSLATAHPREAYSAKLNAWLYRFLAELAELGATSQELRGADAALTNEGLSQFFAAELPAEPASTDAGDAPGRGIPDDEILAIWTPIAAALRDRVRARHRKDG